MSYAKIVGESSQYENSFGKLFKIYGKLEKLSENFDFPNKLGTRNVL